AHLRRPLVRRCTMKNRDSAAVGVQQLVRLDVQSVIARNSTPRSLGKPFIEEGNVVGPITTKTPANFVPRDHGDAECWLPDNEHGLIALIVPQVTTTEGSPTNFENVAPEVLCEHCHLFGSHLGSEIGSLGEHVLDDDQAGLGVVEGGGIARSTHFDSPLS